MSKTILIPTDFSIGSLNLVKEAARTVTGENVRLLLVHGVYLPDSIVDLLFFSKQRLIDEMATKDFNDACRIIHHKYYSQVSAIQIELFTGSTQAAFQGLVDGFGVEQAFVPKSYPMKPGTPRSFDVMPFIRRSGIALTEVAWTPLTDSPDKNMLAELFHPDFEAGTAPAS
jgi:hypothetical protein